MICPFESQQTAAWAEKESQIAVSKLILNQLRGGEVHFSNVT